MKILESGEMYLESIYVLSAKKDGVHAVDVGEYLGYSKPSVSRALGLLREGGYVTVDEAGHLHLTEEGLRLAEKIYERHTVLTQALIGLGVGEAIAAADACRIEHDISDEAFEAIKSHIKERKSTK